MKWLLIALVVVGGGFAGWWFFIRNHSGARPSEVKLRTAKVERGEVVEGVQASGAVQPLVLVQVGTQVSGVIERLTKDFNDHVAAGETIAQLDSRRLVAQVAQDEATVGRSRADQDRVRAQLEQAEKDLARQAELAARKLVSESDLDAAVANAKSLRAQLSLTAAVVSLSLAQLDSDLVNLRYATIQSPVDGVVVSRNVDVGQTVAASLQAPTLYVIANDLSKVQVQASIPEADIGKIHEKQRASFVVDAHPDEVFDGVVSQVRLASTNVQNVVTYTVLIDAHNRTAKEHQNDWLLLPGMTANATIEVARSPADGLKVPVAATRWTPPADLIEPEGADAKKHEGGKRRPGGGASKRARVWVRGASGLLHPIPVRIVTTDGTFAAIEPFGQQKLEEGTEVPLGIAIEESSDAATTNPFQPSFGGPRRGGGH